METAEPVIQAVDVWKAYDGEGDGQAAYALRGATFEIMKGEAVALLGRSGSGKTTLLNILAGLDRPTSGRVSIEGRDLQALGERGRTMLRRLRIGFVFQFFNLLPTLTVFENVFLSLELAGVRGEAATRDALASVGLAGLERRYPHQLSGGEQQRVAIARALVKNPAIILADEPTGNLDNATGIQILDLLTASCRETGTTLVMASHSPLTCRYVGRVLRMTDGIAREEEAAAAAGPGVER